MNPASTATAKENLKGDYDQAFMAESVHSQSLKLRQASQLASCAASVARRCIAALGAEVQFMPPSFPSFPCHVLALALSSLSIFPQPAQEVLLLLLLRVHIYFMFVVDAVSCLPSRPTLILDSGVLPPFTSSVISENASFLQAPQSAIPWRSGGSLLLSTDRQELALKIFQP